MKAEEFNLLENIELSSEEKDDLFISDIVNGIIIKLITKRLQLNMTQRALAEKTGIKQPMIARIEKFESVPRIDTLVKIACALGLSIEFNDINGNANCESVGNMPYMYNRVLDDNYNDSNMYLHEDYNKYGQEDNEKNESNKK